MGTRYEGRSSEVGSDEGGWAIEDDWASIRLDGEPFSGTNIRSFDRETGRWDIRWLPSGARV